MENIGIKIIETEKETVNAAGEIILKILSADADQNTIVAALEILSKFGNSGNISVSNCNVTMAPPVVKKETYEDNEYI